MNDDPAPESTPQAAAPTGQPLAAIVPPAFRTLHSHSKLSEELLALLQHADHKPIAVQTVIGVLAERAHTILVILMTLPFLFPIPTLGLSAPAGLLVVLVGIFLLLGFRPWLPRFLLRREIAFHTLEAMVTKAVKLLVRIEWMFKPRLRALTWPGFRNVIGAAMLLSGLILALPIPIPFANAIPALAIILLGAGLLERDGAFVLAGYAVTIAACVYLYIFWEVAWAVIIKIFAWLNLGG